MATWMTCCLIRRWVWPTALRCAQKKKDMFISRKLAFQNADMTPKKKKKIMGKNCVAHCVVLVIYAQAQYVSKD